MNAELGVATGLGEWVLVPLGALLRTTTWSLGRKNCVDALPGAGDRAGVLDQMVRDGAALKIMINLGSGDFSDHLDVRRGCLRMPTHKRTGDMAEAIYPVVA